MDIPAAAYRECPKCGVAVGVGVQCSLCHQWYHTAQRSALHRRGGSAGGSSSPTPTAASGHRGFSASAMAVGHSTEFAAQPLVDGLPYAHSANFADSPRSFNATHSAADGCVPVPFLMPFFCDTCCFFAREVRHNAEFHLTEGRKHRDHLQRAARLGSGDTLDDSIEFFDDDWAMGASVYRCGPGTGGEQDGDNAEVAARSLRSCDERNEQLAVQMDEALREIARGPAILRSQRGVVQARWRGLFTGKLLRRLRSRLATVNALYRDPEHPAAATAAASAAAAKIGAAGITSKLETTEPFGGRPMSGNAEGPTAASHAAGVLGGAATGRLDDLQRGSEQALRHQRRLWVGEPLDYADVRPTTAAPASTVGPGHVDPSLLPQRGNSIQQQIVQQPRGEVRVSRLEVTLDDESSSDAD